MCVVCVWYECVCVCCYLDKETPGESCVCGVSVCESECVRVCVYKDV